MVAAVAEKECVKIYLGVGGERRVGWWREGKTKASIYLPLFPPQSSSLDSPLSSFRPALARSLPISFTFVDAASVVLPPFSTTIQPRKSVGRLHFVPRGIASGKKTAEN